jgi:mannose-1-phosphate guanylyltransferase
MFKYLFLYLVSKKRGGTMAIKITTAVVLVGGSGLRMRPFTEDMPKCMIPLSGKPLLYWTITWLRDFGFNHVVLGVSYKKEVVIDYIKENPLGIKVDFSEHTQEGETGEGFRLAIKRHVTDENFLAMNGDELSSINLERFADFHLKHKGIATIAVSPMQSPYAVLDIDGDKITGFREKPVLEDKLVSAGIYVFNHEITKYFPEVGSVEKLTFAPLAKKGLLKAYRIGGKEKWLTVNSIKDLYAAEKEFTSMRGSQA